MTEESPDMFGRKKSPQSSADAAATSAHHREPSIPENRSGVGGDPSIAREMDRAYAEIAGPHALARLAVKADPVLFERLELAIAEGMSDVDLFDVPLHRRAQVTEDALDAWREGSRGGPCSLCGSTFTRVAGSSRGFLDAEPGSSFVNRPNGLTGCGWCGHWLRTHPGSANGTRMLREYIFNAVAGVRGVPAPGFAFRSTVRLVPFAHEVGYSGRQPWGHLNAGVRARIIERARQVVHPSRFVMTQGQADACRIPGIETPIWAEADLPTYVPKFLPQSKADLDREAEDRRALERLRGEREAAAARQAKVHANLAARDAHVATLPEDERDEYLRRWATSAYRGQPAYAERD